MKDWNDDDDGDGVHQVRVVVNWKDDDKFRTERTDSPPLHLLHHSLTLSRITRVSVLVVRRKVTMGEEQEDTQLLTVNDEGRACSGARIMRRRTESSNRERRQPALGTRVLRLSASSGTAAHHEASRGAAQHTNNVRRRRSVRENQPSNM